MGLLKNGFFRQGAKAGESIGKRAALAIPRATPYALGEATEQSLEEAFQELAHDEAMGDYSGGFMHWNWNENQQRAFHDSFFADGALGLLGGMGGSFRRQNSKTDLPSNDIITANNFDTNLFDKWENQAGATDLHGRFINFFTNICKTFYEK